MSKKRATFIDLYILGQARPEDISESIDTWHSGSGDQPIYDYLGMTEEEYSEWLRDPDVLPHIVRARKERLPLAEVIEAGLKSSTIPPGASDRTKARQSTSAKRLRRTS
jgi:hypothetical protein